MSLKSRDARRLALAGFATVAALGAGASSAAAAKLTLNYQCKYPLIGVQPLKVDIDAAIPATWQAGKATEPFVINAVATAGGSTASAMQLIGAQTLEGTATAKASLKQPNGSTLPLNVPISIANWTKSGASVPAPLVLNAQGSTPEVTVDDTGNALVNVANISLKLVARNSTGQALPLLPITKDIEGNAYSQSDTDPGTFDVPCSLNAGQNTQLASIAVNDNPITSSDTTAPSKPGGLKATTTASSVSLSWNAASDNVGVARYDVLRNGARVASVNKTSISLPGQASGSSAQFSVVARDAGGNETASDAITASTPANVVATGALAKYNAALTGNATMNTLIKGNLPLEGTIAADMKVADGTFVADLNLLPRTGRLNALGFLPVTARVGFVNAAKTTGSLDTEGVLTAVATLRIKLLDVKLFGAVSIAGGNDCQTKQLSKITLKSKPNFDPVVGGDISGTFSISDLNNCGFLTGIVSPLTAGGGNKILATLKPKI